MATCVGKVACELWGGFDSEPHTWYRNIPKTGSYDISFLTHACYRDALRYKRDRV